MSPLMLAFNELSFPPPRNVANGRDGVQRQTVKTPTVNVQAERPGNLLTEMKVVRTRGDELAPRRR